MRKETDTDRSPDVNKNFHILSLTRREEVIHLAERILKYSQHEEKVVKIKLMLKVKNKKRWSEVKNEVMELREQIKRDVKECIKQAKGDYERRHKGLS